MSMLLLEGQRAVPSNLEALGFQFKYATAAAALQALLKSAPATPADGAVTAAAGQAKETEKAKV
jgi:hypothetical protein